MPEQNVSACTSSLADILRGDYKQYYDGKVILYLNVLRRIDCAVEPTKPASLKQVASGGGAGVNWKLVRVRATRVGLFDRPSPVDVSTHWGEQQQIREDARVHVRNSSMPARIFECVRGALH